MKNNRSILNTLATSILLGAGFISVLLPLQAKADAAEDLLAALTAAGADAETIAAVTWQKTQGAVNNLFVASKEMNKNVFQDVLRIAEQAGVTIDALLPTIQGCIKEEDGTPLIAASVIEIGSIPGAIGSLVPVFATTSGEGVPAKIFGMPVDVAWLSEKQKQNWGSGCYWLPVVPGFADGGIALLSQTSVISHRVIPVMQGYKMSPPAKLIALQSGIDNGNASVTSLDSAYDLSGENSPSTTD
jgi:hypothetical protein